MRAFIGLVMATLVACGAAEEERACVAVEDAYPGTCCATAEQQAEFVFDEPRCFETEAEHEAWEDTFNAALRSGECWAVHVGDSCER